MNAEGPPGGMTALVTAIWLFVGLVAADAAGSALGLADQYIGGIWLAIVVAPLVAVGVSRLVRSIRINNRRRTTRTVPSAVPSGPADD